jgi:hypothetical protein
LPISDAQPPNSGSFNAASGDATLPTGTTAGNAVLLIATNDAGGNSLNIPTGFVRLGVTPSSNVRPNLFFRGPNQGLAAGETSWTLVWVTGSGATAWTAYELEGVDPDAPSDVNATGKISPTGTVVDTNTTPQTTTYDGEAWMVLAIRDPASTTPPTISAHTNSFVEAVQVGASGASTAITHSIARRPVQSLGAFQAGATSSITLGTSNGYGQLVVLSAVGANREVNVAHFWGFKVGAGAARLNTGVATAKYWEIQAGSPTIGADGLDLVSTAAAENIGTGTGAFVLTGQTVKAAVVQWKGRFNTALPGADLVLATIQSTSADMVLRYVSASSKLGVKIGTGSEVLSDAVVTADTFITVDLRMVGTTTAYRGDWQVNYGAGAVSQTQATFTAGGAMSSWGLLVGWTAASTGNVTVAHVICSIVAGHYPLGDHSFALLKADAAGTLTISGTSTNFLLMTANATGAAWNAATALTNITEGPPPTIGASAAGFLQAAIATSDYVNVPMATYDVSGTGSIRAVRMLACGWAASATAATIGFRAFDGTTEMTLFSAADPEFDNSTTDPAWVCKMVKPPSGVVAWDQAKLDALAFRVGFSGDATPDIGIHWIAAEVAIQLATTGSHFGDLMSSAIDPKTAGITAVSVTPTGGYDAVLHYDQGGTPTDVATPGGATTTEAIDAPDAPAVEYVALYPPAEDISDA